MKVDGIWKLQLGMLHSANKSRPTYRTCCSSVTTLCQLYCGMAEVYAVLSNV